MQHPSGNNNKAATRRFTLNIDYVYAAMTVLKIAMTTEPLVTDGPIWQLSRNAKRRSRDLPERSYNTQSAGLVLQVSKVTIKPVPTSRLRRTNCD